MQAVRATLYLQALEQAILQRSMQAGLPRRKARRATLRPGGIQEGEKEEEVKHSENQKISDICHRGPG